MNFKVDDEYFKDKVNYNNLEDNIYSQLAKTMAKNVDIDLAKTPLVDILTGYTRYKILQSKIDKSIEYIEKSMNNPQPFYEYLFGDEDGKVENLDKLLNILKDDK